MPVPQRIRSPNSNFLWPSSCVRNPDGLYGRTDGRAVWAQCTLRSRVGTDSRINNRARWRFRSKRILQTHSAVVMGGNWSSNRAVMRRISSQCFRHNAVVTCEITLFRNYFSFCRRPTEIISFHRVEICLKLFQNDFRSLLQFMNIFHYYFRGWNNFISVSDMVTYETRHS